MRTFKVLFLLAILGISGCESREAARRKQTVNNLRQLGLSLHAYHAANRDPVESNESGSGEGTSTTFPEIEGEPMHAEKPPRMVPE